MSPSTLRRTALGATATVAALVGAVGLAGPAQAASPAPSATAAACDRAPWEAPVQGAPVGFSAGSRSGDYLWHDSHGFHLRVTHAAHDRKVYTGVITASSAMRIEPVKLEKGDVATLSKNHRTLTFAFVNYGRIDGVNFHTDCAKKLTVSRLHIGDATLSTSHVYLGVDRGHPHAVPFAVHRR